MGDEALAPSDRCDELLEVEKENDSGGGLDFTDDAGLDRNRSARLRRLRSVVIPLELAISSSSSEDESEYSDTDGDELRLRPRKGIGNGWVAGTES